MGNDNNSKRAFIIAIFVILLFLGGLFVAQQVGLVGSTKSFTVGNAISGTVGFLGSADAATCGGCDGHYGIEIQQRDGSWKQIFFFNIPEDFNRDYKTWEFDSRTNNWNPNCAIGTWEQNADPGCYNYDEGCTPDVLTGDINDFICTGLLYDFSSEDVIDEKINYRIVRGSPFPETNTVPNVDFSISQSFNVVIDENPPDDNETCTVDCDPEEPPVEPPTNEDGGVNVGLIVGLIIVAVIALIAIAIFSKRK